MNYFFRQPVAYLITFLVQFSYFIRKPNYSYLAAMLGFSAGVMIYVSFAELLKTAIEDIGFGLANLGFFGGIVFIGLIDMLVPHEYEEENIGDAAFTPAGGRSTLMRAGLFTALGVAIHNFPEGLVTFSSAATEAQLCAASTRTVGLLRTTSIRSGQRTRAIPP